MHPESVISTIPVFVVVDHPKTVLEGSRVGIGVQGISGAVEHGQTRPVGACELLPSQILVELGGGEFLVAF